MSTVTGPFGFSNYNEDSFAGDDAWTNPGNILTSTSTKATCNALAGYPTFEESYRIQMYNWGGSGSVDTDAVIENIQIRIYNHHSGITTYNPTLYMRIASGASRKSFSMRQVPGYSTLSGDLVYWDVNNAEALASIHATSAAQQQLEFYVKAAQNQYDIEVYLIDMTVTWSERPPSGGIMLGSFG